MEMGGPDASIFAVFMSTLWLIGERDTVSGQATEFRSVLCDSVCTTINQGVGLNAPRTAPAITPGVHDSAPLRIN